MRMVLKTALPLLTLALLALAANVSALPTFNCVEEWPNPFKVINQTVTVEVANHLARTTVVTDIHNGLDLDLPCSVDVQLPAGARASALSAVIDGKTLNASVQTKAAARETVAKARARNKSAALAEERPGGILHIEISQVKPNSEFQLRFSYIQEVRWSKGVFSYDFAITHFSKELPAPERIGMTVLFDCTAPIASVDSTTHELRGAINGMKAEFQVQGLELPAKLFSMSYTLDMVPGVPYVLRKAPGGGEPNFFALFALPPSVEKLNKGRSIVFVFDKSGSMDSPDRWPLAVEAMIGFVQRLEARDAVNVVMFDTTTHNFADAPIPADDAGKEKVIEFIRKFKPVGGTRFLKPLVDVSKILMSETERIPAIVLLTDGEDNEDSPATFVNTLRAEVGFRVPIFNFAVGNDVNLPLCRALASHSGAEFGHMSRPDQIQPILKKVADKFDAIVGRNFAIGGTNDAVWGVYPGKLANIYSSEPIIAYGRMKPGTVFDLTVNAELEGAAWAEKMAMDTTAEVTTCPFADQMWAVARVQALLDQMFMFGEKPEDMKELIAISKAHLIGTPYTSLVFSETAFAPEEEEELERLEEAKSLGGYVGSRGRRRSASAKPNAPGSAAPQPSQDAGPADEAAEHDDLDKETEKKIQYPPKPSHDMEKLTSGGGSTATEAASEASVRWLFSVQEKDGRWDAAKLGGRAGNDLEATAWALLAIASAGYTRYYHPYNEQLAKAIKWVETTVKPSEPDSGWSKNLRAHAVLTWAMWEFTRHGDDLYHLANLAHAHLMKHQAVFSGWPANAGDSRIDLYTTAYAIQAMVAAKANGVDISEVRLVSPIRYLRSFFDKDGKILDGATNPEGLSARDSSAALALSYMCLGYGRGNAAWESAVATIKANAPADTTLASAGTPLQYLFVAGEVMKQVGGEDWTRWNDARLKLLVKPEDTQPKPTPPAEPAEDEEPAPPVKPDPDAGKWASSPQDLLAAELGAVYSTALRVLMLGVYYRQEPLERHLEYYELEDTDKGNTPPPPGDKPRE